MCSVELVIVKSGWNNKPSTCWGNKKRIIHIKVEILGFFNPKDLLVKSCSQKDYKLLGIDDRT